VESGIDLPWANTIIIHRADLFGMAQLYQLRGRVGRSQTQGYAYLLLPHFELSSKAMRRLSILESLDSLGAGFTLASHDMDIRGVGNLVGSEQSGHIREVGVELYQAMLGDAIQAQLARSGEGQMATQSTEPTFSPQLNLGLSIAIPEDYVADKGLRLSLYRRAGACKNAEAIDGFGTELADRFGPLPAEVTHFIEILRLKALCLKACVSKIDVGPKGAVLSFHNNQFENVTGLLAWINDQRGLVRLRPDHKISLSYAWPANETRLRGLMEIVGQLAGLAG
jgi:transcription-repair coupling factor (superfamily II helicase)